jgi:branched-chain amino acid transport system ATP-binding protein
MTPILEARDLSAGYDDSRVLHGVNLAIHAGEAIGLMGRNGMGKTTLIRTLIGLLPARGGQVLLDDHDARDLPVAERARRGIAMVPENRGIFGTLSVRENLRLAARRGTWTEEWVLELFPRLRMRIAAGGNQLSGGEQQMLAIGRALMSEPSLLLLDEPSLGLAPLMVAETFRIVRELRTLGVTVLLVEQNAAQALRCADRAYVLENGRITLEGPAAALLDDSRVRDAYLGTGAASREPQVHLPST